MAFETVIAGALADIFNITGQSAVFIPSIGDMRRCKVLLDLEGTIQPGGYGAEVFASSKTIEAILSDLPREPNIGEVFEIDEDADTLSRGRFEDAA